MAATLASAGPPPGVNVVTNGSFESGLTGWTQANADGGTGTCSYNGVVAPGTETVTSQAGFPATDGTRIALGSASISVPGRLACYLYQDVAIPAGATTAVLSGDFGLIYFAGMATANAALELGLYPTGSIPIDTAARIGAAGIIFREPAGNVSDTVLHTISGPINVSSVAGGTARLIIINVVDNDVGVSVGGFDNIQLLVTVPPPPPVAITAPVFGLFTVPQSISLSYQPGVTPGSATQTLSVFSSDGSSAGWTATASVPWISLSSFTTGLPGTVVVTANPAGLAVGSYSGTITVSANSVTASVPVSFTILGPPVLSATPSALSIGAFVGQVSATGYDVLIGPAGAGFTAQVSGAASGWLSLTPSSGVAPAAVHVTIDPSKAGYGIYQGGVTITSAAAANSPLFVPVTMSIGGSSPFEPVLLQVSSASGLGPNNTVAPNEATTLSLPDVTCPSDVEVAVNGLAAEVLYFGSGQLNFVVPSNATSGPLTVSCNGTQVWAFHSLSVAAVMPGLFTSSLTGTGQAAAIDVPGGALNLAGSAVSRGGYITLYGTGFGNYSAASADGLSRIPGAVTATIGGVVTAVEYIGESPGTTLGLTQINVQVPESVAPGADVSVTVSVNGTSTQAGVTIAVQ